MSSGSGLLRRGRRLAATAGGIAAATVGAGMLPALETPPTGVTLAASPPAALTHTPAVHPATPNGLAATPPMGWDTYLGVGGLYNATTVRGVALSMQADGLEAAGYRYLWLDMGWWTGSRDAQGNMTTSEAQWPGGIASTIEWLHDRGFKVGAYTDAGESGCGEPGRGSENHYQQDANQLATWGFDAVKIDFCGGQEQHLDPAVAYARFARAVEHNSSGRPMLVEVCNPFEPGQLGHGLPSYSDSAFASASFAPAIANAWRTGTDVGTHKDGVTFAGVLRNLDNDARNPAAAGPGHWNDPDYLAPGLGMTDTEARTQMSMWAMEAAPLLLGSDPQRLTHEQVAMLTNPRIVAIDQDPAGVQGRLVASSQGVQLWVKPLADGARAVAFLNRTDTPVSVVTTTRSLGLRGSRFSVVNAWTGRSQKSAGRLSSTVGGDAAVVLTVAPSRSLG